MGNIQVYIIILFHMFMIFLMSHILVFHLDSNKGMVNGDRSPLQAVKAGLLKILSKMGISLLTR